MKNAAKKMTDYLAVSNNLLLSLSHIVAPPADYFSKNTLTYAREMHPRNPDKQRTFTSFLCTNIYVCLQKIII